MEKSSEILSDVVQWMKYSKYDDKKKRRELFHEAVNRNRAMHLKKFKHIPGFEEELINAYMTVYDKKVLGSMRAMQFSGRPIEINPARQYNCSYLAMDDWRAFSEIMFLLLGGTGVGFSVQSHHIEKLPEIKKPIKRKRRYLIGDSIEGWADAVKVLMKSYFSGSSTVVFDYSDIRAKGERLITSGGKAPGPQPLHDCLHNIRKVLEAKETGEKLTSLEVHDIVCYIADAVLAGGIRRAALISLFDFDDEQMIACKAGNWWEYAPQRARSNNSAVVLRHKIKKEEFLKFWEKIEASNSGEPGIYFSNNADRGVNPCCEISLKSHQFCNLTTVNVSDVYDQEELDKRVRAAAFIGTVQAAYTDFHYLRDSWRKVTEKDALIGVSMTGIASGGVMSLDLKRAAQVVKEENARVAKMLGINPAARTTCVKPEGTASIILGTSSGIHAWHDQYYIRRVRVGKNEAIYPYLKEVAPEMLEDELFNPSAQAVISVPQKAPEGAITRDEDVMEMLERVRKFNVEWVQEGHRSGQNTNNVSATVSIGQGEWEKVGEWMWENRHNFNGLSVLPKDLGTYKQAPFETCTKEEYERLLGTLKSLDLSKVVEDMDNTDLSGEIACGGGGSCEVI